MVSTVTPRPRPIENACFWLAERRRKTDPPLIGRREADIVIIGAGFTGLWTATFLKMLDPSREIVVLEQGIAAYGASGRNAGMLGEAIDHSHQLAITHFGRAEAARLARLGVENLGNLLRFLEERRIDCDLERTGQLHVALTPSQVEELREAQGVAQELGLSHYRLLDAAATRAEAAVAPGTEGEIVARRVILATNAYTHQIFPRLQSRFIPLYDYILVSEPLSDEQMSHLGWRRRCSVADMRTFFKYYRLTRDNRILWGTSEAAYYKGNRVDASCDHSERHYAELRDSFRRHFPALADLEFPYAWGGPICSTTRFTPFFGAAEDGRILYGLGYTGHGLGTTHLAGQILAHMALERPSPLLDLALVRRKPFPYTPEPLRSLAVRAVTRALRRVDTGRRPGLLLRCLDAMGIGLSS